MVPITANEPRMRNQNPALIYQRPPAFTRALLTVILSCAFGVLAAPVSAVAQTRGDTVKSNAEREIRRQFESIPYLLTRPPAELTLVPRKGAAGSAAASPMSPAAEQLLAAGTDLHNAVVNLDPEISKLFGGRDYTAQLTTEKLTELTEDNQKLVTVYNMLDESRKKLLEETIKKIPEEEPFRTELRTLQGDYGQYQRDCTRAVPIESLAAEQAKCDRRAETLKGRDQDLRRRMIERIKVEAEKIEKKFAHGQPGMIEIEQKIKANFKLFLKLQDLRKRVVASLSKFAALCPDAAKVNDIESLKYCAAVNWDNPPPDLSPLRSVSHPGPVCEAFCGSRR